MRSLIWLAGWFAVAFWSLVSWGAWAFFGLFATVLKTGSGDAVPGFPLDPLSFGGLVDALHGLGGFVFVLVWGSVSAAILAATWVMASFFRRPAPRYGPVGGGWQSPKPPSSLRRPAADLLGTVERLARAARERVDRR